MENAEIAEGRLWDNVEMSRFELVLPDGIPHVLYERSEGRITLKRAETPTHLRGKGYAAQVSRFALESARREGLRVTILCGYIVDFVRKNPVFADLVD